MEVKGRLHPLLRYSIQNVTPFFPLGTVFSSLMFARGHWWRGGGGRGGEAVVPVFFSFFLVSCCLSTERGTFFSSSFPADISRGRMQGDTAVSLATFTLHSDTLGVLSLSLSLSLFLSRSLSAWLVSSWAQASENKVDCNYSSSGPPLNWAKRRSWGGASLSGGCGRKTLRIRRREKNTRGAWQGMSPASPRRAGYLFSHYRLGFH